MKLIRKGFSLFKNKSDKEKDSTAKKHLKGGLKGATGGFGLLGGLVRTKID